MSQDLYLDLLKRCLTRSIFETAADLEVRRLGQDWPSTAETMVGLVRLENVQHCVESVLRDRVPGDLIEAGVWRGGVTIFMRALLEAHGDRERRVWVADSFRGLPRLSPQGDPADDLWRIPYLAVGEEEVRANFAKYGLLDERVVFLPGLFKDTLPGAPIDKLAVARLDGDLYESTMDALTALYPKLAIGGFLVVDDYSIPQCQRAVDEFRTAWGVVEPLEIIDWTGVFWRKEQEGVPPRPVHPRRFGDVLRRRLRSDQQFGSEGGQR